MNIGFEESNLQEKERLGDIGIGYVIISDHTQPFASEQIDTMGDLYLGEGCYELYHDTPTENRIPVYTSIKDTINHIEPDSNEILVCIIPPEYIDVQLESGISDPILELNSVIINPDEFPSFILVNDMPVIVEFAMDNINNGKLATWAIYHGDAKTLARYDYVVDKMRRKGSDIYQPTPYARLLVHCKRLIANRSISILEYLLYQMKAQNELNIPKDGIIYNALMNDVNYSVWKVFHDLGVISDKEFDSQFA